MTTEVEAKTQTRSSWLCDHKGCGGNTEVLRTVRQGSITTRYRRCTTCQALTTTRETRHGDTREPKRRRVR